MGQVCFNDVMLHNSISYHQKPLSYAGYIIRRSRVWRCNFTFQIFIWFLPLVNDMYLDEIIRGQAHDVASYMIHAGLVHLVNDYRVVT
jgi:hypothetical protein